jgi:hypothetical protein
MSTTLPPDSPHHWRVSRAESAQAPTPTARRRAIGFWSVAGAFAVIMGFSAVPTPLYGLYAQRDGFGALTITIVFAVYVVGVVVGLLGVGHISDWYGRRPVLISTLATAAVSGVIFLFWRDLSGLIVARLINGFAIGATSSTATAWLSELHGTRHAMNSRLPEIVAAAANLGGVGAGALIAGLLAQWISAPLTVPYLVFLALMVIAATGLVLTPETHVEAAADRPRYHPQRLRAPAQARGRFYAALTGAFMAFAAIGFFTSLAPSFLAGPLGSPSVALAGAVAFLVTATAAAAPIALVRVGQDTVARLGAAVVIAGTVALVVAVELSTPSLWLFLTGGAPIGIGAGAYFRSSLTTVLAISDPATRAGTLVSLFLSGYIGMALPVLGLGVLVQHIALNTALLLFGALLVVGVSASIRPMLHQRADSRAVSTGESDADHAS